jgi:hypothetical protein
MFPRAGAPLKKTGGTGDNMNGGPTLPDNIGRVDREM